MHKGRIGIKGAHRKGALGLLAAVLFMRLLVPAGWMPAAGGGYAIKLCTIDGATTAWVDEDGDIHKESPEPARSTDHPCTFAGFSSGLTAPDLPSSAVPFTTPAGLSAQAAFEAVTIGRGLAAPPPPPTGPPTANL